MDAVHVVVILMAVVTFYDCQRHMARAYPYIQRKPDPFVALANTLRQQEREEQRQQQQFHGSSAMDNGYYYDYGREGPSEEDVLRMEQFQRLLSRAAMMPFFARTQRSWGNVVPDPEYGFFYDRDDPVSEMEDVEDDPLPGSEWHDDALGLDQGYDGLQQLEERPRVGARPDNQLLLDTLSEYMMLYGGMATPNDRVRGGGQEEGQEEEVEEEEEDVKRSNNRGLYEQQSRDTDSSFRANREDNKKKTTDGKMTSLSPTPKPTAVPTSSTSASIQLQSVGRKETQPPVQRSQDGTPLGQKEFPMMRPATPPRNNWFVNHMSIGSGSKTSKSSADNNAKRHAKVSETSRAL